MIRQEFLTTLFLGTVALRKWLKGGLISLSASVLLEFSLVTVHGNRLWQPLLSRTIAITPAASLAGSYLTVFLVRF